MLLQNDSKPNEKKPNVRVQKASLRTKYDNRCRVSYPDGLYELVRKWSMRKGINIQDFQRKAAEFYVEHLEQSDVVPDRIKNR